MAAHMRAEAAATIAESGAANDIEADGVCGTSSALRWTRSATPSTPLARCP